APAVKELLARVLPGQTLFVHPYKPLLYFLTQARNPTRFCYLTPLLMTKDDERRALADLRRQPPQWVLYLDVPPEELRRVFPSADPNFRFDLVEDWLKSNYEPAGAPPVSGYVLMRRAGGETTRSTPRP
ncbi:MAG: hypothetical protein ACRD96_05460, partial [Bryobacteraceae bacterium]